MRDRQERNFFVKLRGRPRGHPRAQRAAFLVASGGLVLGSLVAVNGATAISAGASVGVASLGHASTLQRGRLARALQTNSAAIRAASAVTRKSTSHRQLPTFHVTRAGARALTTTGVPFP